MFIRGINHYQACFDIKPYKCPQGFNWWGNILRSIASWIREKHEGSWQPFSGLDYKFKGKGIYEGGNWKLANNENVHVHIKTENKIKLENEIINEIRSLVTDISAEKSPTTTSKEAQDNIRRIIQTKETISPIEFW